MLAEAERLNELRAVAMEERAEALLALGRHHRVIPELEWLVSEHPLRERPVALLMRRALQRRSARRPRSGHSRRSKLAPRRGNWIGAIE